MERQTPLYDQPRPWETAAQPPGAQPPGTPPPGTPPPGAQPPPTQPPPTQPPGVQPPGAQPPAAGPDRPKWTTRRTTAVTAAAATAVIAIGGVAVARSGDSGTTAAQGTAAQGQQAGPGGTTGQAPGGGGGLASALHGEIVTQDTDGSYVTRLIQSGEVTAVSATSITVVSADDFSATYAVSADTVVNGGQSAIGDVATGATVSVTASEDKAALSIVDQSQTGPGGFPGGGPGGQAPGTTQDGTTQDGTT